MTDHLTRNYAKALTVEALTKLELEQAESALQSLERKAMLDTILNPDNEKVPQWKADLLARDLLDRFPECRSIRIQVLALQYRYTKARVRLAVIDDRVRRRRAKEYNHGETA